MTESRQAEATFDASLFEGCRQALLRLQGIVQKRKWDKLPVAEQRLAVSLEALKRASEDPSKEYAEEKMELFQQLERLQRSVSRDLFMCMQMNKEDQASLEQGMQHLKRLSGTLSE